MLTGGPVLLAVAGGAPAEVTALFAGLALFRAPYTLALGLVAQLTERLTGLVVRGRREALRRFRIGVVLATLGRRRPRRAVGAWAGPPLMELVFGDGVRLPGGLTLLLAVGTVFALANLVLTVTALARGRTAALVRAWLVGAVPGALLFWLSPMSALDRTAGRSWSSRPRPSAGWSQRTSAAPPVRGPRQGFSALRKIDEPKGRSRRRSSRLSARDNP